MDTDSIVIIICAVISVTIIAQFTNSIRNIFNTSEIQKDVKKATFTTCFSYIAHSVLSAISQTVVPHTLCELRLTLQLTPFVVTRAALYYFFIVRTEQTFAGTVLAFNPAFIKKLKVFLICMYAIFAIFYVLSGLFRVYDAALGVCWFEASSPWLKVYYVMAPLYTATDFFMGLYIVGVYLHRLWRVHKYLNIDKMLQPSARGAEAQSDNPIENGQAQASNELLYLIKKQGKLAFVSYLSTVFFIYNTFLGSYITSFSLYADGIVNVLCVYCTFAVKQHLYERLCNCGGNKGLLCMFCFCCHCCNTPKVGKIEEKQRVPVGSVTETSAKSMDQPSSNAMDNSSVATSDVTATDVIAVEVVVH